MLSLLGAEGGLCSTEVVVVVVVVVQAALTCALCSPQQPLPDNSALLMNQSTLKQLPETARQRQLHAFKICKKFQVGDGVSEHVPWRGAGLGGLPCACGFTCSCGQLLPVPYQHWAPEQESRVWSLSLSQ